MSTPSATLPRVIVAGGGPAAIETILALRDLAPDRLDVELLAPNDDLVLRPLAVLAPFREGREGRYPLRRITADAGARFESDAIAAVEPERRRIVTRSGHERQYDTLVLAVGARSADTVAGAVAFRDAQDAARLSSLLSELRSGRHPRLAFIVPGGVTWPLPMYELALQTASWLEDRDVHGVELTLISPEPGPLAVFGQSASEDVAALLDQHRIRFVQAQAVRFEADRLLLVDGSSLSIDWAIALPRLLGPRIHGLPADRDGFLPVDELGRVEGVNGVFAIGDASAFPIKQGGLATQQADAVAERVAADAGAPVEPHPFQPVLRGLLLGGRDRRFLRAELTSERDETSTASATSLWWPPSKLAGRYLAPYLDSLDPVAGGSRGPGGKHAPQVRHRAMLSASTADPGRFVVVRLDSRRSDRPDLLP